MLQRKHFSKGYTVHAESPESGDGYFIKVEESYDGKFIEIMVGQACLTNTCPDENLECGRLDEYRISLTCEQIKELQFCLKQLHFIDDEKK